MDAALGDPPELRPVREAYRCVVCGYGAFLLDEFVRCPMCGQHRWDCDRRYAAPAA